MANNGKPPRFKGPPRPGPTSSYPQHRKSGKLLVIIGILALTFICFTPALSYRKEFTNWDDTVYVTRQDLIRSLSKDNIVGMFSPHHSVASNFHPITILSLAVNYRFSRLTPRPYFLTNIALHLLNVLLVFVFVYRLSCGKFWWAVVASTWFGIHPMHVESVAWISGRKDLLSCLFFLAACIAYQSYSRNGRPKFFILTFLFFVLSCLSKATGVVLPVVLILMDAYEHRPLRVKGLCEKVPFLLVSLWLGFTALQLQARDATIAGSEVIAWSKRFLFACYGFINYLARLFYPSGLSAFYPYPVVDERGYLPVIYYVGPLVALAILAGPVPAVYRKDRTQFEEALFGIGFFLITIAPVSQLIPVGGAIMADRYTYLPYVGLLFILGGVVDRGMNKAGSKAVTIIVVAGFTILLAGRCYSRTKVWNDSGSLWTDAINRFPYEFEGAGNLLKVHRVGANTAYKNRGSYYFEKNLLDRAYEDYHVLEMAEAADAGVYGNLGIIYASRGEYGKAVGAYSRAIELKADFIQAYMNRGNAYTLMREYQKARGDYDKVLDMSPGMEVAYRNRAFAFLELRMYERAIADCNVVLGRDPGDAQYYFYRGTAEVNLGRLEEAIADLQGAVAMEPSLGNAWYNLSVAFRRSEKSAEALAAAQRAKEQGYPVGDAYLAELKKNAK